MLRAIQRHGVHVIDMVLYLMGNPTITTVSGATYSKLGPQGRGHWAGARFRNSTDNVFEVDDLATALLRTADGATIQIETSWASYSSVTDEYGVALMGDNGGGEIHVHGSARLAQSLAAAGLVDRYTLLVFPLLLGSGKKLFGDSDKTKLALVEHAAYGNGITLQRYDVVR